MKIALAQINPTVGDVAGNRDRVAECIHRAESGGAELVVFGELAVVGYPPRDLLRRPSFVAASVRAVEELASQCHRISALVGFVRPADGPPGRPLENAAALLAGGRVAAVRAKTLLPTYDVFDETRYFRPGPPPTPLDVGGVSVGVSICEDLWDPEALGKGLYAEDPVARLRREGAAVIVNMSASPFQLGKVARRQELIRRQGSRSGAIIAYVNQVGGNDELIFDGFSTVVAADGSVLGRARGFAEDLLIVDTGGPPARCEPVGEPMEQLASALRLGLRDYTRKCGFRSAVLGLSGGIDSAVVAVLAVQALGAENVLALSMPSRYSSDHSRSDAERLAANLGIPCRQVPIGAVHEAYEGLFDEHLPADRPGTTDENIQARIRGALVMAFSNAMGHLPLATGNKSELATGYCTLYGDMNGGLSVIGDVPKTTVYALARHLNEQAGAELIPERIITKPPSAELKPDQTDQDALPPYDVLDAILSRHVEQEQTVDEIVAAGFEESTVRRVVRMVSSAEYKRRQAAPALKVTARAFGTGRRFPIACRCDVD
ncbi:MAG: NAD+ synthase [Planctomycetota bacterium]|jgi:NAD+ synthetase